MHRDYQFAHPHILQIPIQSALSVILSCSGLFRPFQKLEQYKAGACLQAVNYQPVKCCPLALVGEQKIARQEGLTFLFCTQIHIKTSLSSQK